MVLILLFSKITLFLLVLNLTTFNYLLKRIWKYPRVTFLMPGVDGLKMFPEYMRIGINSPNERVPQARLGFRRIWGSRVIRNSLYEFILDFIRPLIERYEG